MKFAYSQPGFGSESNVGGQGRRVLTHYALKTLQSLGDLSQSQVEFPTIDVQKNTCSFGVPARDDFSRFTEGDLGRIVVPGIQVPNASIMPK